MSSANTVNGAGGVEREMRSDSGIPEPFDVQGARETARSAAHGELGKGELNNIEGWLEALPLGAFFEQGEEIVAANELARKLLGSSESVPVDQVFIGAFPSAGLRRLAGAAPSAGDYPARGTECRQRFECLLSPLNGMAIMVTGAVQPCEAAGPGGRLVLVMEPLQGAAEDSVCAGGGGSTFLEELFDSAPEAMVIIQQDRILRVNREFERMFGYTGSACVGGSLLELVVPEGRYHENEMLLHMVEVEGRGTMESVRRGRSGRELDVSITVARVSFGAGRSGLSVTYRDIHQEKEMKAKLQHTALHDPLTGLANRVLFMDRLTLTMARLRRRPDRNFAVVFLDLDHFKQVNDTLGHSAGDTLLLTVSARLRTCLRPQDTVARFGGDEFALIVDEVGCREDIESMADRIQSDLLQPVEITDAGAVHISASIGIALGSLAYKDVEEILRDADAAMYRAKENGKARYEFFDSEKMAQITLETPLPERDAAQAA